MKKCSLFVWACCMLATMMTFAQKYEIKSPNQALTLQVELSSGNVTYALNDQSGPVMAQSYLGMVVENGILGSNAKLLKKQQRSVRNTVSSPFYRRSEITEAYNELTLSFKGDYKIVFRLFDQGLAYRFETTMRDSLVVSDEIAGFFFPGDYPAYIPYVSSQVKEGEPMDPMYSTSFENTYTHVSRLGEMDRNRLAFLPLLVELPQGRKVVITESDLRDYPGMYLRLDEMKDGVLRAQFAPRPKHWVQGGHNNLQYCVDQREDHIAKTAGTRTFPWRVIAVSSNDKELVDNDMVYLLAHPSKVADLSWIKPGKVAWDWWNNWNIWGVDFKSGVNNETYRYFIDFAADNGIEYVIMDEGWAVNGKADLMQVVPEIDLPMLVKYAEKKNVGLVLWAGYAAMDQDMERVCRHYSEMGIKGFKVDFMDRDDQLVVDFYERMAATAAKHHLFVDFHGSYKPTGLNRTYPNVLNYEGVFGQEQCKWIGPDVDMVTYDVTIPFIRMLAGPLDYTPGAMRNAAKGCFAPAWSEPMSQGTRCHQLAEYVVFDAPFSMLCDAPTAYLQELECLKLMAGIPTVWDETRILDAKVGEYVITARRKGTTWYVGVLNNWERRSFDLDLSALSTSAETVTIFRDGANADRKGSDYRKVTIANAGKLHIDVAQGGGAVIILQ